MVPILNSNMDLSSTPAAMNFTENQLGIAILDKLRAQRVEGRFCDVTFLVENQVFRAHRNVLAACSPYFDTMLKVDRGGADQVAVDCKHEPFEVLLDYIYTGTIVVDHRSVEELIRLSNRFLIPKLKGYCSEYLERNISVSNCFMTKNLAQTCGLAPLSKNVDAFLLANITDILQQDEVLFFSEKKIQELVSNKTLPVREELKILVINRWVHYACDARQYRFQHLLTLLSWNKVNPSVVYTILNDDMLYKTSEYCLYVMLSVMDDQGVLSAAYHVALNQLRVKFGQNDSMTQILQLAMSSTLDDQGQVPSDKGPPNETPVQPTMEAQSQDMNEDTAQEPTLENFDYQGSFESESEESRSGQPDIMLSAEGEIVERSKVIGSQDDDVATLMLTPTGAAGPVLSPAKAVEDPVQEPIDPDPSHDPGSPEGKRRSRGKHKRKGIPVKIDHSPITVRIAKSRIKMENIAPKKRGRPRKLEYNKDTKKANIQMKQKMIKKESKEIVDCDEENGLIINEKSDAQDIDSGSDADSSYKLVLTAIQEDAKKKGKRASKHARPKISATLSCDECDYMTTSTSKLEKHHKKAHKDKTKYSCPICSFQSAWNRQYYHHMKAHFPGPPFVCDFSCGYTGDRIQQLLYHRMTHTDERPFECTVCNLTFRSKNNLAMHVRCHTGAKPFKCEVCERSFATKGTLDQHSVTHSDLRPYLCDLCGFSTKYQSHLIAHKRIHTGDVFKCQYPNCKYSTPKRSQLACHMRTHMSLRSHICSICGRAFVEKSHLVRHEKIHLDEKPFKCDFCDYGSTRRDKLKDHVSKYHESPSGSPPKSPYKPRKARRQVFDPQAFPVLTSEQASQEMQSLLQQSDSVRHQQKQDISLTVPNVQQNATGPSDDGSMVHGNGITSFMYPNTTSAPNQMNALGSGLTENSSVEEVSNSVQSMLPLLSDNRLPPVMMSTSQPLMIIPHSAASSSSPLLNFNSGQLTSQSLHLAGLQQIGGSGQSTLSQTQLDAQNSQFSGLQNYMNIF